MIEDAQPFINFCEASHCSHVSNPATLYFLVSERRFKGLRVRLALFGGGESCKYLCFYC